MDIQLIEKGDTVELVLNGRLDTNTSRILQERFDEAAGRFDRFIMNMEGLTYCSSAGIRILRYIFKTTRQKGGSLTTINVSDDVMDIFKMTGVTVLLEV